MTSLINTSMFDQKESELKTQFELEQKKAIAIEEQIKALQSKLQEGVSNMTRLQGAFALLQELKRKAADPAEDNQAKPVEGVEAEG